MAIKNISHVAIGVADMDRALPFWTEVVGLRVSLDGMEQVGDVSASAQRRAVYLREQEGADEPFIVLDELQAGATGAAKQMFEIGVHHFGFWVDDVEPILERARAAGTEVFYGPVDSDNQRYGEQTGPGIRTLLLRDPEGNVIQFDQRLHNHS